MLINKLVILLSLLVLYLYFYYSKTTYISKSKVQGEGLFSSIKFSRGDIILENIFPNKDINEELYEPIKKSIFNEYMGSDASKINHCSRNDNSYVYSDDYKIYKLIAKKNIFQHDEITVNYNVTHADFPFIGQAKEKYNIC